MTLINGSVDLNLVFPDTDIKQELLCSVICEVLISRYRSIRNLFECRLRWFNSDTSSYSTENIKGFLEPLTSFIFFDPPSDFFVFGDCEIITNSTHRKFHFTLSGRRFFWDIRAGFCDLVCVSEHQRQNSTVSSLAVVHAAGGSRSSQSQFSTNKKNPVLKLLSCLDRALEKQ